MPAAEWAYAGLSYMDRTARAADAAGFGAGAWQVGATAYDTNGNLRRALTPANLAASVAAGTGSLTVADELATLNLYNETGDRLLEAFGPSHQVLLEDGTAMRGRAHTVNSYDDTHDGNLVLRTDTSVVDPARTPGSDRDVHTVTYDYAPVQAGDGDGFVLRTPTRVITEMGGGATNTRTTRYDAEGKVIETRQPGSDGTDAGATATTYWTAGTNSTEPSCGNKPQWAGLACRTGPVAQPAGQRIPVAWTTGYSYLLAPTVVEERPDATGPFDRRTNTTYDRAGRATVSSVEVGAELAGSVDPGTQTFGYDPDTALPTTVTVTGAPDPGYDGTVSTGYDSLARVVSYTDVDDNQTVTSYNEDGRVETVNDGKGLYTYAYDGTDAAGKREQRGLLTALGTGATGASGTFTAGYDADARLTFQGYPNGLSANTSFDEAGEPTSLTYTKDATAWLAFTATPDAVGRTRAQTSPPGGQDFGYDPLGRLVSVDDHHDGACTARRYTLDPDSNRTTLNSWDRATAACDTTGTPTSTDTHAYDTADRVTDPGNTYDPLGRTLTAPASAVGGTGALSVGYHHNDLVASMTQGSAVKDFTLDPTRRLRAVTDHPDGDNAPTRSITNHYSDADDNPAWINQTTPTGDTWTRNITGPAGDLAAIQNSDGSTSLQLANLHGDITATTPNDPNTPGTDTTYDYTEYGTPRPSGLVPDRYGWLGGKQRSTDTLAGLTLMGVRLYNPSTGRFLQPDPVPGGSATAYDYCNAEPINCTDLDGQSRRWLRKGWGWVKRNRRQIVQVGVGIAAGAAAGVIAAGFCGATAGLGCLIVAGAVARVAIGGAAHYTADRYMGYRPTWRATLRYAASDLFGGARAGAVRGAYGRGSFGFVRHRFKPKYGYPGRGIMRRPFWQMSG
jgi:RHS repeat-associated protein